MAARVYCAGPLFNEPERAEMSAIAAVLEAAGHETFLPQRDGFELSDVRRQFDKVGLSAERARGVLHRCIFDLDVYHLLQWSDVCVANINGRVPDEGTVVEAALTWGAGRPLVLYKADDRAPFAGDDNPMLTCLSDLRVQHSIEKLPAAVADEIARDRSKLAPTLARGRRVADALKSCPTSADETPDAAELAVALTAIYEA